MPELPDVTVYIESLERYVTGQVLERARVTSPFLVRSVDPPLSAVEGQKVLGFRRLGKRIVFVFDDELYMVVHLMIAGRFRWRERGVKIQRKVGLAAFDFPSGSLLFTEAATKKRASLHVVRGAEALEELRPEGIEVLGSSVEDFGAALQRENRTLKRALTNPHTFSGIGNAYSDEILHAARLSPLKRTKQLAPEEIARLHEATVSTMTAWIERLRSETGDKFPEKVTAFRKDMAVHGRFREPCPVCGSPVQRIVFAENEMNYCATCQTEGRLLADRALSKLLKGDWPKTLEEWES